SYPKSLILEIHHGGCFTPIPSRSYVGGHVSSVNVDEIDEFYYGLHLLNVVDADVLEMAKYVKDYKIILVYVEHGSSIFVTPKKGVSIAVDNHLRKGPIEIDSSPDVNRNLTPMCHRNLTKEWEQVSSKSLSIGEVMKNLSKKQPSSYVEAPIVVECADDPFEDLDEILGDYANTRKQINGNEITGKQMVVHVGNSSTVDNVLNLKMLFKTKGVGPVGKFKEVDLDCDPNHDDVFDNDEHIVEEVYVNMNNFSFTADPKHDTIIDHVIKSLATNPDILVRAIQDQMQKQFEVGVSKMKAFRAKRIASDIMTGPWPGQILTAVGVDANSEIYPISYAIVEAESKASWCWLLNILGEGTREMWPVVEATTVIVPLLFKLQIGRLPKKRKKSYNEIANESCSSGKLTRKGKSVRCGKCGNIVDEQWGERCRSSKTVSGQAGGASNVSSQFAGSSQPIAAQSTSTGARNASSQPSAAPNTASQGPTQHSVGPRQGFQAPRPGFPTQRLTKAIASRHNPRKLSS
ncbi:hypothetical protein Tco_0912863, partial [Tanacetum coccineum]